MNIMKNISKILDVVFYHVYSANSLVEYFPEYSATYSMAATIAFVYTGLQGAILSFLKITKHVNFIVLLLPVLVVLFIAERSYERRYIKSGRYKRLRIEKPVIVNRAVSIIITITYFLSGVVFLVGGGLICGGK